MLEIIVQNMAIPAAATVLTFLLTRKKYKAEAAMSELSNVETAIEIWKKIAIDLKVQQQETYEELTITRKELKGAYAKIDALTAEIRQIKLEINKRAS